jgi:hypothetical protein
VTDAASARALAHGILSERRFHQPPLPRPLHGILTTIGDGLQPIGHAISRAVSSLVSAMPFGSAGGWALLAVILAAVALALLSPAARRSLGASRRVVRVEGAAALTAAELEREAAAAELEGHFDRALRLRFHAGLLRLDERHVLAYRPSLTSSEVARRVRSPAFQDLARRFDEVIYGGRRATAPDAEAARDAWARVLAATSKRSSAEPDVVSRELP